MANQFPPPAESLATSATTRIDNLLSLTLYKGLLRQQVMDHATGEVGDTVVAAVVAVG